VAIVAIAVLGAEVVREPEVDVHLGFLLVTVVLLPALVRRARRAREAGA
jgi:hypothetical protein